MLRLLDFILFILFLAFLVFPFLFFLRGCFFFFSKSVKECWTHQENEEYLCPPATLINKTLSGLFLNSPHVMGVQGSQATQR